MFLLQCILTSVVPFLPSEILMEAGFSDRSSAQRTFSSRAHSLYEVGAEKSQLARLQGSLVLTASYFAFGEEKDLRYWLSNAVRLAVQTGLHLSSMSEQLEKSTRSLFVRIFWVLYSRDILMVMAGRTNLRHIHDADFDVPEFTEEDWEDEHDLRHAEHILSPVPRLHILYLVHNAKLARLCELSRVQTSQPSVFGRL